MPISRRELYLDHGRVTIECPRLMSDEELAVILEAFVKEVAARPRKESINTEPPTPSRLPYKMKPPKGPWR